jgi:hypothetical protein
MRRLLCVLVAAAFLIATDVSSAVIGLPPGPKSTKACANLAFCFAVNGLWVNVPAHGEATYLFNCPERAATAGAFLLGGTDARVSSAHVHVWYVGKLGGPVGSQTTGPKAGGLLFHASSDDGKPGSFQPVLGCISLRAATKRSTLSAGVVSPPLPTFRARTVVLEPGWDRTLTVSCARGERLVGNWSALAFGTANPPVQAHTGPASLRNGVSGGTARVHVQTSAAIPYLVHVQVGAMCEP